MADEDGNPDAGRRYLQLGQPQDPARLVAHAQLLRGPPVLSRVADPGHDVEGQRGHERRRVVETVAERRPHVTGLLPQPPLTGDGLELVVEPVDARLARTGRSLVGRDHQLGEPPTAVEGAEGVDHRQGDARRVGDDAPRTVAHLGRVDLRRDQRDLGVPAEGGAVVDDDRAPPCRDRHPLGGHVGRHVEQRDVDAVEDLLRQLLHDKVLTAHGEGATGRLLRRDQPDLAPDVGTVAQHAEHDRADGTGRTHQGQGGPGLLWDPGNHRPEPP